jgi:dienelactone hydrolase
MLHRPDTGGQRDTAVLLCPPFGWQYDCSYRGLRAWATQLARAGYAAARLALPASADSAGSPLDPDRVDAWTTAVSDGAAWLREATGAGSVVVIGIGLGGLVAFRALAQGAPVDELVLWAVPSRGRAMLHELRGHHQIIAAAFPEDDSEPSPPGGDVDLVGYLMSAQTVGELEELRLTALELRRPPRRALLLGRDGIGPDAKLAEHLRAQGTEVEAADGQDYAELMANPQQSVVPQRTIDLTLQWLRRGAHDDDAEGGDHSLSARASGREAEILRCEHEGVALRETPQWFEGVQGRIFGILTEPEDGGAAPLCVVLLGAGALPHTGPNRSWVELSRRWAARGVPSLRIDLGGVGESDGEDPELLEDESFYDPWRDREVAAVLDQLSQRGVADRFVLGGLCSGAYRSLRRALVDPRVRGLLLLNLYCFAWSHELVSERGRRVAIAHGMPRARGHALNREFLGKALEYARPDRAWRLLRRSVEREHRRVAVKALDQLRDQRVATLLLLGTREPLLEQFEHQGVLEELDRWPTLTLDRSPSADHMYRARWLQRHIYAALDAAVERAVVISDSGVGEGSLHRATTRT